MKKNLLLIIALAVTASIAVAGILDPEGLAASAAGSVAIQFNSRAWFIMLTVSFMLIVALGLAISPAGRIRLGKDDERPEFSTVSWLTMLFAAGMGVGILYWGTAEPLTHYLAVSRYESQERSGYTALFLTNFHWGLHAWAIYAMTGLVVAYFAFRRDGKILVSEPIVSALGSNSVTRAVGWICDLLAIIATAIGLGGSMAMGVFQVQEGVVALFGLDQSTGALTYAIFGAIVLAYVFPLMVDLSKGMALLSNIAMGIAAGLMIFILIVGPTGFIMGTTLQAFGDYASGFLAQGFRTFTLMDKYADQWFQNWTLTYMIWWLAWAPFVGVFIARISRGRTIREFICGVLFAPTGFSILWFGVFGSIGFFGARDPALGLLNVVENNVSATTFFVLQNLPLTQLTTAMVVVAAFLFIVTSVVSAAFVLGMFSTAGSPEPSVFVRLSWGAVLGALGLVMILSGSVDSVKSIIALGAMPFVFIVLLMVVCLLKMLKKETVPQ